MDGIYYWKYLFQQYEEEGELELNQYADKYYRDNRGRYLGDFAEYLSDFIHTLNRTAQKYPNHAWVMIPEFDM